jgi:acyl-CoA reductase-like NAD-dependent aldehyde dehydrogenase
MVRAAYSSGTPAIGVGAGNAPVWVCADADPVRAAQAVVDGKSFDHGIICGSENNLVVDRSIHERFVKALRAAGAAVLGGGDCDKLQQVAFDEHGRLRRTVLGQPARAIAELANIAVPADTRLLVAEVPRQASRGPFGREKLAPMLSLFTVDGDEDGLGLCRVLLGNGGDGHTAIVHSTSPARQAAFAQRMPASRILVNGPGAHGCIGLGNGLTPSLTLGCGTYGNNSTTDNVTYTHLMNIKRLAHPLPTVDTESSPRRAAPATSSRGWRRVVSRPRLRPRRDKQAN